MAEMEIGNCDREHLAGMSIYKLITIKYHHV